MSLLQVLSFLWMVLPLAETDSLPDPVALYPLNGRHGTKDISRNENPQGIPSNTALAPGPNGHPYGSFQFSGTPTSYVHIPNNGGLDIKNSITILAWVNRESNEGLIIEYSCQTCFRLWFVNDGRLYCNAKWHFHQSSPIPSNSWYHVGASYDSLSGTAKVWVNGQAAVEINDNNGDLGTHYDLRIAARPQNNSPFKGRICCIQVYDKALNQQEIIAVQNRTLLENIDDQFYPVSQTHQPQQSDFLTKITSSTVMECLTRCSRLHECNSVVFDGISTGQTMKGFCQLYKAQFEESLGHQENMHKRHFNKRKRQI